MTYRGSRFFVEHTARRPISALPNRPHPDSVSIAPPEREISSLVAGGARSQHLSCDPLFYRYACGQQVAKGECLMFREKLNRARNGRAILFCGAGYSSDCLNFADEGIGASQDLCDFLNTNLADGGHMSGFRDLKNAADHAKEKFGINGLMNRLKGRYKIKNVSFDMVEILKFPWERIYTTNYDDAIEISLARSGRFAQIVNNLDRDSEIIQANTPVIHLHGAASHWDIHNFERSCILGADSYHSLDFLTNWLNEFRRDLDRAEIIVFVGFNAGDFHLNHVLRDVISLKEKVYFINRESSSPDIDVRMTQSRFGTPLYIGRQGLANEIGKVLKNEEPIEPALSSFYRYIRQDPAEDVPSTSSIEDLLIFGNFQEDNFARDVDLKISEYHVTRSITQEIIDSIYNGSRIILLKGEICDGKTIVVRELSRLIDVERPVFVLRIPYDDILSEIACVLDFYKNAAILVENCFDLSRDRLVSLARQISASKGILILTSRSIAAEARAGDIEPLKELPEFREFSMSTLDESEVEKLVALTDQIAGWSEFGGSTNADRRIFVERTCRSSLPSFLISLLNSRYVKDKYLEEYNKIHGLDESERLAIVTALYISHIGDRVPTSFLSDVFELDAGALIERLKESSNGLKLLRIRGSFIETIPAIGATSILKELVSDNEIVASVVRTLRNLSGNERRDDLRRHVFSQMMRYSIIQPVVSDTNWIDRFFDNVSQIEYIRRQVLFWLQWSIALREKGCFVDSEKKLDQAYREAESYEKRRNVHFDRRQLDDVKAKFLVARATATTIQPPQIFRDLKEACDIVGRLLRIEEITHHPFQTLQGISSTFVNKGAGVDQTLHQLLKDALVNLLRLASRRVSSVPSGYQQSMASEALRQVESAIGE